MATYPGPTVNSARFFSAPQKIPTLLTVLSAPSAASVTPVTYYGKLHGYGCNIASKDTVELSQLKYGDKH